MCVCVCVWGGGGGGGGGGAWCTPLHYRNCLISIIGKLKVGQGGTQGTISHKLCYKFRINYNIEEAGAHTG